MSDNVGKLLGYQPNLQHLRGMSRLVMGGGEDS
jgi:hypothetical protein